jgi:hypothetical protein
MEETNWNELSRLVDVNGSPDRQPTVRGGVSIDLLEPATHDTLGDGICEAKFTRAARSRLTVFRIGKVSTTDSFNVANLVVG